MTTIRETTIHAAERAGIDHTGNAYHTAVYGRYAGLLLQPASHQALVEARDAACRRLAEHLDACASMATTDPDAWRELYTYRNARATQTGRTCQASLEPAPLTPSRRAEIQARLRQLRWQQQPGPVMEAGFKQAAVRAKDAYHNAVYERYLPLLLQGGPRQALVGARVAACRRLATYLDVCAAWATAYPASWRQHARPAESA